ncbi:MAG: NUDIX domain-containing protein [Paracoccus sp. (in: a-proteobacteria)]|nr:NUDIX domain-containing protein [Paracoccus sp. (in: a-proteobacteria)]
MSMITLIGPLAAPDMLDALGLEGRAASLRGHLHGGAEAGLGGAWPRLGAGGEDIALVEARDNAGLRRYAAVMGLRGVAVEGRVVLGLGTGEGADWSPAQAGLMAAVAREILALPGKRPAEDIARRLPQIADMAQSRLLAQNSPPATALLPPPVPGRVRLSQRRQPYADFFAVEEYDLRHRLHQGGWSEPMTRAVFISHDAVLVLPWDPVRDHVALVSQFRMGPLARHDPQLWVLEPVAGRVDAGETPEQAARRETAEEAGLSLERLIPLPGHYPTPGANSEFFHPYIGIADLPEGASREGGGVEDEQEDIATHIIPRSRLSELVETGEVRAGPLLMMSLWLDRHAARLREGLART